MRDQPPPVLLGLDPAFMAVGTILERIQRTDLTVLMTGETGTGKDLVARLIHAQSRRKTGPFIVVDCPAIPATLFESELFGHERGAFTGAVARHPGKVEQAQGGTLFLDEIGELPLDVQAKLLRFVQGRCITRLGAVRPVGVDVRLVAATNRDLLAMVAQGTFRADLYYRLNVMPIHLPPLRQRASDIALLVDHFVRLACAELGVPPQQVAADTMTLLAAHDWPGNVRELENVIRRACVLSAGRTILPDHLPATLLSAPAERKDLTRVDRRERILDVLRREGWNVSASARALGVHRATVYRKMMALGIRPDAASESGSA